MSLLDVYGAWNGRKEESTILSNLICFASLYYTTNIPERTCFAVHVRENAFIFVAVISSEGSTSIFKRTLSPYFRNLPLLHITIRLHLTSRLLKFMQWLARKQYVLGS